VHSTMISSRLAGSGTVSYARTGIRLDMKTRQTATSEFEAVRARPHCSERWAKVLGAHSLGACEAARQCAIYSWWARGGAHTWHVFALRCFFTRAASAASRAAFAAAFSAAFCSRAARSASQ
jgi:hypothetical protein